ncbi:hypothetical protein J3F83DRAFT_109512 [Trichoderma novae-zelandiae]
MSSSMIAVAVFLYNCDSASRQEYLPLSRLGSSEVRKLKHAMRFLLCGVGPPTLFLPTHMPCMYVCMYVCTGGRREISIATTFLFTYLFETAGRGRTSLRMQVRLEPPQQRGGAKRHRPMRDVCGDMPRLSHVGAYEHSCPHSHIPYSYRRATNAIRRGPMGTFSTSYAGGHETSCTIYGRPQTKHDPFTYMRYTGPMAVCHLCTQLPGTASNRVTLRCALPLLARRMICQSNNHAEVASSLGMLREAYRQVGDAMGWTSIPSSSFSMESFQRAWASIQ